MGRRQEEARREDPGRRRPNWRPRRKRPRRPRPKRRPRPDGDKPRADKKPGKPAAPPSEEPDPKAQKNFTDPESRIMKTKDGFIQGYNAQAAVDATAQVIVAHGLDAKQSDQHQLAPMRRRHRSQFGQEADATVGGRGLLLRRQPCGDGGTRDRRLYRAGGGPSTPGKEKAAAPGVAAMRERSRPAGNSSPYRLRKQLPEPVFGQIKQARGFRQFLLRGVEKVANEWGLVCLADNTLESSPKGGPRPLPHSQPAELRHLGNGATNDGRKASTPYIKPDAQICCIRLSDWLERFKSHLAGIKQTGS